MTEEITVLKIGRLKISFWIDTEITNGLLGVSFGRPFKNYPTQDYYIGAHFVVIDVFFTIENKSDT